MGVHRVARATPHGCRPQEPVAVGPSEGGAPATALTKGREHVCALGLAGSDQHRAHWSLRARETPRSHSGSGSRWGSSGIIFRAWGGFAVIWQNQGFS